MATRKLVIVKDHGYIPELKATGPIRTPSRIPIETIRKLLVNGRTVYECDPAAPADDKKRIKLTLQDIIENAPEKPEAPVAPENPEPVAPAEPESPVEPPAAPENDENAEGDPEESGETDDDSDDGDSVPTLDDVEPEDNTDSFAQNSGKKKNKKRR